MHRRAALAIAPALALAALHPATGALWTHDHGPQGGDELNLTQRGGNHG